MGFVENLIVVLMVQKLWKSVHIWQSYHRLSCFYGPRCICKSDSNGCPRVWLEDYYILL